MGSELQQASYASELSHIASPLNSARSNQSTSAAARRVGMATHGVGIQLAKRAALVALTTKAAEEQAFSMSELERFDQRLDACLSERPRLAISGRLSLPLTLPEESSGSFRSTREPLHNIIARAFAKIDKNGNGELSRAEVIKACKADAELRAMLNLPQHIREGDGSREAFERIFQQMDADDDKVITFDEFHSFFAGFAGGRKLVARKSKEAHNTPAQRLLFTDRVSDRSGGGSILNGYDQHRHTM